MASPESSPFLRLFRRLSGGPKPGATAEPPSVLVLDEDSAVRQSVRASLEPQGYRVDAVASSAEALARLRLRVPALLVADVATARAGRGLFVALAEDPAFADIPVVLLQGPSAGEGTATGAANPVVLQLVKPFDPQQLARAVRNAAPLPGDDAPAAS